MPSITIHDLDEKLHRHLTNRAEAKGRSTEQEVSEILFEALKQELESELQPEKGLGTRIHERFKALGGVDLELPPREPMREPPRFD